MMTKLLPNERLDDLQIRGYEIIQSPGRFCFGMDAVLLSAFANVKKHEKALDLGTGMGILPILLPLFSSHRTGNPGGERRYGKAQRQP